MNKKQDIIFTGMKCDTGDVVKIIDWIKNKLFHRNEINDKGIITNKIN